MKSGRDQHRRVQRMTLAPCTSRGIAESASVSARAPTWIRLQLEMLSCEGSNGIIAYHVSKTEDTSHRSRSLLSLFSCSISCRVFSRAATKFDLNEDFSVQQNSNRVWEYGYSATNSLDPAQFRLNTYVAKAGPLVFWHPPSLIVQALATILTSPTIPPGSPNTARAKGGRHGRARSQWKPVTPDNTV